MVFFGGRGGCEFSFDEPRTSLPRFSLFNQEVKTRTLTTQASDRADHHFSIFLRTMPEWWRCNLLAASSGSETFGFYNVPSLPPLSFLLYQDHRNLLLSEKLKIYIMDELHWRQSGGETEQRAVVRFHWTGNSIVQRWYTLTPRHAPSLAVHTVSPSAETASLKSAIKGSTNCETLQPLRSWSRWFHSAYSFPWDFSPQDKKGSHQRPQRHS